MDKFHILKRNEQVIEGSGEVESVDVGLNQINATNIAGFTPVANQFFSRSNS